MNKACLNITCSITLDDVSTSNYSTVQTSLVINRIAFFFLNDLFLYLAIDTVFHPSGIIQNGMEISSKSHV